MARDYRDPYYKALVFIPTKEDKDRLEEQKEMQRKSQLLDDKLSQADELIAKLNAQLERKEQ